MNIPFHSRRGSSAVFLCVILSALVIVMNLVVDLAYRLVDPRITLTAKED